MNIQYYDKDKDKDAWLQGKINTVSVEAQDGEIRGFHADNLRYPGKDGTRCQVCGQSIKDKTFDRLFMIAVITLFGLGIAALIKYLYV